MDLNQSNKSAIDYILAPVFNTVRKNKINSFRQFKDLSYKSSIEHSYIFQTPKSSLDKQIYSPNKTQAFPASLQKYSQTFPKTAQNKSSRNSEQNINFITFLNSKQKFIYEQLKQDKQVLLAYKNLAITKPINQQKTNKINKTRIFSFNQKVSKIKKHLIDKVDFDEIQKKLFKQRECKTRYQNFMERKSMKKGQQVKKIKKYSLDLTNSSVDKKVSFINIQNNMQGSNSKNTINSPTNCSRNIRRKKFWLKPSPAIVNKYLIQPQLYNSLNFVKGKAYKTISN